MPPGRDLEEPAVRPFWKRREIYLRFGVLLMAVATVVVVVLLRDRFVVTEKVGYPAIALLNLAASASIFVPVPGIAASCVGGWLLSPLLVALVSAVAAALGELTGYAAGFGGGGFMGKQRLYQRTVEWMKRWGWLVLFVLSIIPNPVFDAAGVAAGALRYPVWKFLGILCVGKFIKFLAIAYACAFGIESVLRLFNLG
jgi:membrane protein YqaA with SNARE-associated domain